MSAEAAMKALLAALAPILLAAAPPAEEATVAVVELPRGVKFVGLPQCCPGDDCTTPPEETICTAELYDGKAKIVRLFSGPGFKKGTTLRFTAHAIRTRGPFRLFVRVMPFEDGKTKGVFAHWYDRPEPDGQFCTPVEWLKDWPDGPVRQLLLKQPIRMSEGDQVPTPEYCLSAKSS